ncbi:hypothetical protein [Sphingomonas sp. VNH70]|uniref:hypothetical protein n=1 Tax=Sphingomonas silueang TaxID=3156617 RepID=UPI0032B5D13B
MDLDPLCNRSNMIPRIGAIIVAELVLRRRRERMKALDRDLRADPLDVRDRALGIASGLIAENSQLRDPRLER